jgi:predicted nucleic acid-binding protein
MYLIDTNVISEVRKGQRANAGVQSFFSEASRQDLPLFLSAITIGELRLGVALIRHRADQRQAEALEAWLGLLLQDYGERVLPLDGDAAQLCGRLRVPDPEHLLDKQIAAITLLHHLTVVTRNTTDFPPTDVPVMNPFIP